MKNAIFIIVFFSRSDYEVFVASEFQHKHL